MSSLMAVLEKSQVTFAVDTAHSNVICDIKTGKHMISRYRDEEVDKVYAVEKDMVFIAGLNHAIDTVKEKLNDFLNNKKHVNIELLKQYLKKNYPYEKCPVKEYGFSDIGLVIIQVINNEAIITKLDQCNDFKPEIVTVKENEVKVSVDGFDSKRIYENGIKFLNSLPNFGWRTPEALTTVYQNNYSEGVGNSIRVYRMDDNGCNLIKETKLVEENLRYINIEEDGRESIDADKVVYSSHLMACDGTFVGTLDAGKVIGGTIDGTTITGSTLISQGTDLGYLSKTVINDGLLDTHSIRVMPMNTQTKDFVTNANSLTINPSTINFTDNNGNSKLTLSDSGSIVSKNITTDSIACNNLACVGTNNITPTVTTYGNLVFGGGNMAANTDWVTQYFAKKSALTALEAKVSELEAKVSALESK